MGTYKVKSHKGGLVATFDTQLEAATYIQSKDDPYLYVDVPEDKPQAPPVEPNDYFNKSKHEGEWVHLPFKELFLKFKTLHYIFLAIFTLNLVLSVVAGTFISGGYLYGLTEFTVGYCCVIGVLMFMQRSRYILTEKGEISYREDLETKRAKAAIRGEKANKVFNGLVAFIFGAIVLGVALWLLSGVPAVPMAIIVGALIIAAAIKSKS